MNRKKGYRPTGSPKSESNVDFMHRPGSLGPHLGVSSRPASSDRASLSGSKEAAEYLGAFPHQGMLERAFGRTIPGLAVVDSAQCSRNRVPAFTEGRISHFASYKPSLRVAAHEAAHLFQHAGLTRDAHLNAEGHAQSTAHLIERGLPARHMLGSIGSTISGGFHPYTEIDKASQKPGNWNAGKLLRVSEDGRMAVAEEQSDANHSFWALPDMIGNSNSTLSGQKSVIRLKAGAADMEGPAPDGSGNRTLSEVVPENQSNSTAGTGMKLWADCGKSCRDVVGAGEGTGWNSERMSAGYQDVHRPWYTGIPLLGPLLSWIFGGPTARHKTTTASDPEEMKKEIFNQKLGGTGDEGLKKYEAMSAQDRDAFDKDAQINRYAAPATGQGYTMSSGGNPAGPSTWNFHWAGVIMTSGSDRVTLENYSVSDPTVQNADWQFEMYGSAAKTGQTFFEQHKATGQHGDAPTAMQVEKH